MSKENNNNNKQNMHTSIYPHYKNARIYLNCSLLILSYFIGYHNFMFDLLEYYGIPEQEIITDEKTKFEEAKLEFHEPLNSL